MEMSISCDNLLCDALGRAPSCRVVVYWRNLAINVSNKVGNSDSLNGRRKSLKDASKTDSDKMTENPNNTENMPRKFEGSFSGTRLSETQYQRQTSNPIWQKYGMTEIAEVSCESYLILS